MSNKQLIAVIAMGKLEYLILSIDQVEYLLSICNSLYAQFPVTLLSALVVVGYRSRIYMYFD